MQLGAKLMWGLGSLVPTLVLAAAVASTKDYWVSTGILLACAALAVFGNDRVLRAIERTFSRRLVVQSSESKRPAADARGLLALLVPGSDVFGQDLAWAVMLAVLLAGEAWLQIVKPAPPALFMLVRGYRYHDVVIKAGTVKLWTRCARLGAGDVVTAAEPEQRLWIGRLDDDV